MRIYPGFQTQERQPEVQNMDISGPRKCSQILFRKGYEKRICWKSLQSDRRWARDIFALGDSSEDTHWDGLDVKFTRIARANKTRHGDRLTWRYPTFNVLVVSTSSRASLSRWFYRAVTSCQRSETVTYTNTKMDCVPLALYRKGWCLCPGGSLSGGGLSQRDTGWCLCPGGSLSGFSIRRPPPLPVDRHTREILPCPKLRLRAAMKEWRITLVAQYRLDLAHVRWVYRRCKR